MRRTTKKAIVGIVLLFVGGVVVMATLKSPEFTIVEQRTMMTLPPAVFAQIRDLKNWPEWSKESVEILGAVSQGVGAQAKMNGIEMILIDVQSDKKVHYAFNITDWNVKGEGQIELEQNENSTVVTWSVKGFLNFKQKLLFILFARESKLKHAFANQLQQLEEHLAQKQ